MSTSVAPRPWGATERRLCLVVALIAAALWLPRLRGPIDLRYDAGVYYVLGVSLGEGRGYRLLNEPGAIEAIQYPPLLPAIGALHRVVVGTSDPVVLGYALRLTAAALFIGYAVAVFALARRVVPPKFAFIATLMAILNAQMLFLSDSFAADVPYAALSTFFFLAPPGVGAGLLAVATYGLRTAGVALLAAWVMESLLRRRFRQAAARGATAIVAVGLWQGYVAMVKSRPTYDQPAYAYQRADYQYYNVGYAENMAYVDPFRPELGRASTRQLANRVWTNLKVIPTSIGEATTLHRGWLVGEVNRVRERLPWLPIPDWTVTLTLFAMSAVVVAGLAVLAVRGHWLLVIYAAGSVALITLTPWPGQFNRYLLPLAPILTLAFVSVPAAVAERAGRASTRAWRLASTAGTVVIAFVLVQQLYTVVKVFTKHHQPAVMADRSGRTREYRLLFYDRSWRLHDDALDSLRGVTRSRAAGIVGTSTPHLAYLRTGLPSIMPPYEIDPNRAQQLLEQAPVDYLVVDKLEFLDVSRRYAAPVVTGFPDRWSLLFTPNDSGPRIYRRVGNGASSGASK